MINIFYKLLRISNNSIVNRIVNKLGNLIMPVFYIITPPPLNKVNSGIIVSLTTFPKRINTIHLVIQSLLRQSVKPKVINLYLSKVQFGNTLEKAKLPKRLLGLQKYGVRIIMVDDDLRSYKKFQYAFQEFPNDLVVTVDDDIIYNSDLIETLLKYKKSNNVTANLTRKIARNENGEYLSYAQWIIDNNPENDHIVIGAGGVLYSPAKMYHDILNKNLYLKLAPKADDLWLSAMSYLGKLDIIPTGYANKFLAISIPDNQTLFSENREENNDQVKAISNYYIDKIGLDPFSSNNQKKFTLRSEK